MKPSGKLVPRTAHDCVNINGTLENGNGVVDVTYAVEAGGSQKLEEIQVEKAPDFSFNTGKAWEAWAGIGLNKRYSVPIFEDTSLRHRMIEDIYHSAKLSTRDNYL